MIRLLFYILLIYIGYRIIKAWGGSFLGSGGDRGESGAGTGETELIRDPQCGVYFLKQRGVMVRQGGETLHFCSTTCRDRYLEKQRGI